MTTNEPQPEETTTESATAISRLGQAPWQADLFPQPDPEESAGE